MLKLRHLAWAVAAFLLLAACTSTAATPDPNPARTIFLTQLDEASLSQLEDLTYELISAESDETAAAIDLVDIKTELALALAARWSVGAETLPAYVIQLDLPMLLLVDQELIDPTDIPIDHREREAWLDNTMIGANTVDDWVVNIGGAFAKAAWTYDITAAES